MYYAYILLSSKSYIPWKLVWYGAFSSEKEARNFERYLKTGSGKSFAYKRLVSEALKKDFQDGRIPWYSEAQKAKDT